MYSITTTHAARTYGPAMNRPLRERKARRAQHESGYCPHGVYVGGCGIDWMCGACEDGVTRRALLDATMRRHASYRVEVPGIATPQLGLFHDAAAAHALARLAANHGKSARITRTIRQDGRTYATVYTYTPA